MTSTLARTDSLGFILTPVGNTYFVRQVLPLKLNVTPLASVFDVIVGFQADLSSLTKSLNEIKLDVKHSDVINHWLWQLDSVERSLRAISYESPTEVVTSKVPTELELTSSAPSRRKRGLFNFMGEVHKFLWGTATVGDVDALRALVDAHKQRIDVNSGLIVSQSLKLKEIKHILTKASDQVELLTQRLNDLYTISVFDSLIAALYNQVTYYSNLFHQLITNFNLLNRGIVNPTLLPYSTLFGIVEYAITVEGLMPAVPLANVEDYYSLIRVDFIDDDVLLYLPFVGSDSFTHSRIIPFPSMVDEKPVILVDVSRDVLTSHDGKLIANPESNMLNDCKKSKGNQICLPQKINFVERTDSCESRIIDRASDLSNCHFKYVNLDYVVRESIQDTTYLFFPQKRPVIVSCPDTDPQPTNGLGRLVLSAECTISTEGVQIWGVHRLDSQIIHDSIPTPVHLSETPVNSTFVPHIRLPTMSPVEEELHSVTWIQTAIPSREHLWLTIVLYIILIAVIIYCLFRVMRPRFSRSRFARFHFTRASQQEVPSNPEELTVISKDPKVATPEEASPSAPSLTTSLPVSGIFPPLPQLNHVAA